MSIGIGAFPTGIVSKSTENRAIPIGIRPIPIDIAPVQVGIRPMQPRFLAAAAGFQPERAGSAAQDAALLCCENNGTFMQAGFLESCCGRAYNAAQDVHSNLTEVRS